MAMPRPIPILASALSPPDGAGEGVSEAEALLTGALLAEDNDELVVRIAALGEVVATDVVLVNAVVVEEVSLVILK